MNITVDIHRIMLYHILTEQMFFEGDRMSSLYNNRVILHCDLNNFFASVEAFYKPELKLVPMAVCGSVEERHGIVLAKNDKAKAFGVKTAEPIWQAKNKCPELVCVEPHYDRYVDFSGRARAIYSEYTDMVEPFGIDECWLDVTGSSLLFGTGEEIAHNIRERIKSEIGVTISVGVSFNKIFAKLGSDLKKPDAVTVLSKENFKEKIWDLPADSLIGVGKATMRTLERIGLKTIGDVARCKTRILELELGKNGLELWKAVNGYDTTPVLKTDSLPKAKSFSHGTTQPKNLVNEDQVRATFISLAESVAHNLRKDSVLASVVSISIRDERLVTIERQRKLRQPTRLVEELVSTAMELFRENWDWHSEVRSVTIHAGDFVSDSEARQYCLFCDNEKNEKLETLESYVDKIRAKYGKNSVVRASAMKIKKPEQEGLYNPFHPKI